MALEGRNIFHVWAWVYFSSNGGMHAHKCTHMYKAICKHTLLICLSLFGSRLVHITRSFTLQLWSTAVSSPRGGGGGVADLQGLQAIHRGCQFSASGGPDDLLTNHDHMPSLPANNMHTCLPEKQPYNAHNAGNTQHLFKLEKTLLTGRVLDSFLECYHPL